MVMCLCSWIISKQQLRESRECVMYNFSGCMPFTRKDQWLMNISYTLISKHQLLNCLHPLPILLLHPISSFNLSWLFISSSSPTTHTIGPTSQTTPQPSKDSRPFRRFLGWGAMEEECNAALEKAERRGEV